MLISEIAGTDGDGGFRLYEPTLFMNASTATADTPLRRAVMQRCGMPAGGLVPHDLDVLFQVRLGLSGLHAPVSPGVLAVSSRTIMNNAG